MRRCSRCKIEKPADREHFSFIKSKDRWHPWCKPCCAEARRRDRAKRPEHYQAINKRRDPERVRVQQRVRYHSNLERSRRWNQKTPEQIAQYNANRRAKRQNDPDYATKIRERNRLDRERHPERYAEYQRRSWRNASSTRRLRTYFTSAICHSLQGRKKGGRSWEAILGHTTTELRDHLERQFAKDMSWDNYGDWHVDHIVPVASFDFSSADDADFKACWAITNLRPLWADANMQKHKKRTHLL